MSELVVQFATERKVANPVADPRIQAESLAHVIADESSAPEVATATFLALARVPKSVPLCEGAQCDEPVHAVGKIQGASTPPSATGAGTQVLGDRTKREGQLTRQPNLKVSTNEVTLKWNEGWSGLLVGRADRRRFRIGLLSRSLGRSSDAGDKGQNCGHARGAKKHGRGLPQNCPQQARRTSEAEFMSQIADFSTTEVPYPRAPRAWRLQVIFEGSDRLRVVRSGERLVLGSSDGADWTLCDPTISSRHCAVEGTKNGLRIVDLGSKNGVFVGAGRVGEALLGGPSSSFSLGRTTVLVQSRSHSRDESEFGLVGRSHAIERVRERIVRFAPLRAPVLITGESGTGKDVVARAIHERSERPGAYFPLNVAALSDSLLDAELFGHERGAFTGAVAGRRGLFEAADAGTLFLDEIAEMSAGGQAKLLRVVEEGKVRALGADASRTIDTRLVSATCAPLAERIAQGTFRSDLYHRLSPLVIELPPLRKRREDISLLSEHYLKRIESEVGPRHLSPAALSMLEAAPWPGNVRQLFGALYRACALTDEETIHAAVLGDGVDRAGSRPRLVAQRARELLDIHGSMSAAARAAGVPRTTFRSVLERERARKAPK